MSEQARLSELIENLAPHYEAEETVSDDIELLADGSDLLTCEDCTLK